MTFYLYSFEVPGQHLILFYDIDRPCYLEDNGYRKLLSVVFDDACCVDESVVELAKATHFPQRDELLM